MIVMIVEWLVNERIYIAGIKSDFLFYGWDMSVLSLELTLIIIVQWLVVV